MFQVYKEDRECAYVSMVVDTLTRYGFLEYNDSIGVCTFGLIIDAPGVGSFCEFLDVDHNDDGIKPRRYASREYELFE